MPEEIKPEESLIEKTQRLIERMAEENKKSEELLKKNEEIMSRIMLSGKSTITPPAPVKEETPKEYLERLKRETGKK